MEMTGCVIAILPEKSGTSARGEWHSQSYVIETQEQYPKHLCFDVFGADRIAQFAIQAGEMITVSFDIDARQWQDRWFNQIRGWNVVRPNQQPPMQGGYNMKSSGRRTGGTSSTTGSYGRSTQPDESKQSVSTGTAARSTGRAS